MILYLEKFVSISINPLPNRFGQGLQFQVVVGKFTLNNMKVILKNGEEGSLASSNVAFNHDQDCILSKGSILVGHSQRSTSRHRHFL